MRHKASFFNTNIGTLILSFFSFILQSVIIPIAPLLTAVVIYWYTLSCLAFNKTNIFLLQLSPLWNTKYDDFNFVRFDFLYAVLIVPFFVLAFYLPGFYGDLTALILFLIASFTDFLEDRKSVV